MKKLILMLAALFVAGPASSQVYYNMIGMPGGSGYRSVIFETVTTNDFLRAPAFGFMRFSFTQGNTFEATVYACDTPLFVAITCTSLERLSGSDQSIELNTGRPWIIIDVTVAETAGDISYIGFRGHFTTAGGSSKRGRTFIMCDADGQAGTEVCEDASNVDIFAKVDAYRQFTATFSETGANATCDIYYGDKVLYDDRPAILTAADGVKINSTQFSSSVEGQSFEAPFYMLWVICTKGTGTHSFTIQASD